MMEKTAEWHRKQAEAAAKAASKAFSEDDYTHEREMLCLVEKHTRIAREMDAGYIRD